MRDELEMDRVCFCLVRNFPSLSFFFSICHSAFLFCISIYGPTYPLAFLSVLCIDALSRNSSNNNDYSKRQSIQDGASCEFSYNVFFFFTIVEKKNGRRHSSDITRPEQVLHDQEKKMLERIGI
jgi:hypothetical protein